MDATAAQPRGVAHAVQPDQGAVDQLLEGGVAAVGGHGGLQPPPQLLQRHQFRRAEGEEGQGDPGCAGRVTDPAGVMGRGVVPDQQLGHLRSRRPQRRHGREHGRRLGDHGPLFLAYSGSGRPRTYCGRFQR
jgi:hypothetical protein